MRIAVAGGTGVVGSYAVDAIRAAGHHVVVMSRGRGVDLLTGDGLDDALDGVDAVIDVSNVSTLNRRKAVDFFTTATTNLLEAEERAGVGHHVALSIVGVDRVDSGYYAGKLRQEELVLAGSVPSTVLRATQFHEFAGQMLARVPGPIAVIPKMPTQPVAAREVGQALAAAAVSPPAALADELAGPTQMRLIDMVRAELRTRGDRRRAVELLLPMAGARGMAAGALLPTGPGPRGVQNFDEWLAAR